VSGENELTVKVTAQNLTDDAFAKVKQNIKDVEAATDSATQHGSNFSHYLEELDPRASTLTGTFGNMRSTLSELWENPTAGVQEFAGALSGDLGAALGSAAIGIGAVAGAVVVVGAAFFELAEHAAGVGGNLNDVSEKTGITVPQLSRLSNAAQVAGSDINTMSNAIFMMQRNMAEGGPKFEEGMQRINVSLDDFKKLTPDQQLLAVAEGLKATEDPSQRAAAAMEIFGRQGRDLIPTLNKLDEAMQATAGIQPWTDEEAHQAEEFEMSVKALKVQFEAFVIDLGRDVLPLVRSTIDLFREAPGVFTSTLQAMFPFIPNLSAVKEGWLLVGAALDLVRGKHEELPISMEQVEDRTRKLQDANVDLQERGIKPVSIGQSDLKRIQDELTEKVKEHVDQVKKQEDATRRYHDSLENLTVAERGYLGVLDALGPNVVNSIRYELEHKAAVEDVARVYRVNVAQVREIQSELKFEDDARKEVTRSELQQLQQLEAARTQAHTKEIQDSQHEIDEEIRQRAQWLTAQDQARQHTGELWGQYFDLVNQRTLSSTEYQKEKVLEWRDNELAQLDYSEANWQDHWNAIDAVTNEKLGAIERQHSATFQSIQAMLKEMSGEDGTTGWGQHFSQVLIEGGGFKDAMSAIWGDIKTSVKHILEGMLSDFIDGYLGAASRALGGWLAGLGGGGGGGGGGWWSWLAGLIPGHGGGDDGSTPITGGHFDPGTGQWVPDPASGGGDGGSHGPPDADTPHPHEAHGGVIPGFFKDGGLAAYFGDGGIFQPRMTDTVPAMLTPGEGILNTRAMDEVGEPMLHHLNRGGSLTLSTTALEGKVDDMKEAVMKNTKTIERMFRALPTQMRDAVLLAGAH
jgi:hypothetical protein